jgi:hypothetical protein
MIRLRGVPAGRTMARDIPAARSPSSAARFRCLRCVESFSSESDLEVHDRWYHSASPPAGSGRATLFVEGDLELLDPVHAAARTRRLEEFADPDDPAPRRGAWVVGWDDHRPARKADLEFD